MHPVRCVTISVASVADAQTRYAECFGYVPVADTAVDAALAASWGARGVAGRRQVAMRPASGALAFLRFVEADPVPGFRALRTFGWSAVELCVQDVHATHARLAGGPFDVIGPPSAVAGLPTIHPMQVLGVDHEVVYLTQILAAGPSTGLPVVQAPVDRPFIVVLACTDLERNVRWCVEQFGQSGVHVADDLSIPYRTLNRSFDLPAGTLHRLVTFRTADDIFLELDQYPAGALPRPASPGRLPPGIAIATLAVSNLDAIPGPWSTPPAPRDGAIYEGRRVGVLRSPDGALFEMVEG